MRKDRQTGFYENDKDVSQWINRYDLCYFLEDYAAKVYGDDWHEAEYHAVMDVVTLIEGFEMGNISYKEEREEAKNDRCRCNRVQEKTGGTSR